MFINRENELKILEKFAGSGNFIAIWGRRRLGKTALIKKFLAGKRALYMQAIEAESALQIEQMLLDASSFLPVKNPSAKDWDSFFSLLNLVDAQILCIDEFPYLVASDASVPSRFQRWLDHSKRQDLVLILSGSSQRMMLSSIIEGSAPLYGRAIQTLRIKPMGYREFCLFSNLRQSDPNSFIKYSMVGAVPLYWKQSDPQLDVLAYCEELFFTESAPLEREAARVLDDEEVRGMRALSVLDLIGRGVNKPSEIAARLGTSQVGLTRALEALLASSLIEKEIPFGEIAGKSKKGLYKISDPYLKFHSGVYTVHSSRWNRYTSEEKMKLLRDHASLVFEMEVRKKLDAIRYWDKNVEVDGITAEGLVLEVKFRTLRPAERARELEELQAKWQANCGHLLKNPRFEVKDLEFLSAL